MDDAPNGDAGRADTHDVAHLVQEASAGSLPAVDELVVRYLPELRAWIRLQAGPAVRAREEVSDLCQSVCREVLAEIEHFHYGGESGFRSWLFATALRRIRKKHAFHTAQLRDVRRDERPSARSGSAPALVDLAAYARELSSPSGHAVAAETAARIERAFDALGEDERDLIMRSRLAGQCHRDIAADTGRSEGAVRVALHRALARLARHLDETPPDD